MVQRDAIVNNIFDETVSFDEKMKQVWNYQYKNNKIYNEWCSLMNCNSQTEQSFTNLPFLPISFFKTHKVISGTYIPEAIFESSGTTTTVNSQHFVKDISLYNQSFMHCFEMFYGNIKQWCIIGLLPSYLERKNSSLVVMVDALIKSSSNADSGFYLYEFEIVKELLIKLEKQNQKTLLIGVTFALLDLAEQFHLECLGNRYW